MNRWLFIHLIFTGVIPLVPSVTRRYYLIQQTKSWFDAQAYCRATHTDLAIIGNAAELVQLQAEAQKYMFTSSAWIGLDLDVNSWRWCYGAEPLGNVTFWIPGEPNNNDAHQECAVITSTGWNDRACAELHRFICFDARYTGSDRYIYYANTTTWYLAQSYCQQHHTDLAVARDAAEQSALIAKIPGYTWFGLVRDTWKWLDETAVPTSMWMSGQPDNYWSDENCGYISSGQLKDGKCSDLRPFFCHRVTMNRQTIRVKLLSDQDVNDPAVTEELLHIIQQKLMEHGITEDLRVTFTKQPEMVVFHKIN